MNETPNGMIREDKQEKIDPLDYTTPHNELRYAAHMFKGAKVHGSGNWKNGGYGLLNWVKSARRHLLAMEYIALDLPVPEVLGGDNEDHPAALRFASEGFMNEQRLLDTLANRLQNAFKRPETNETP